MSQEKQVTKKAGPPEIILWAIPGVLLWAGLVVLFNNFAFPLQDNSWAFFLLPLLIGVFYAIAAVRKLGQSNFAGALMYWGAWLVSLAGTGVFLNTFLPKVWEAPWWITTAALPVLGLVVSVILRFTGFFQQFVPQPARRTTEEGGEAEAGTVGTTDPKEVKQAHGLLQQVIVGLGGNHVSETVERVTRTDEIREQRGLLEELNRSDELVLRKEAAAVEKYRAAKQDGVVGMQLQRLFEAAYGTETQKPVETSTEAKLRAKRMQTRGTRIF